MKLKLGFYKNHARSILGSRSRLLMARLLRASLPDPGQFLLFSALMCNFETWDWSVTEKKILNLRKISKPKAELTKEELGNTKNCSVCLEDQTELKFENLPSFKICSAHSEQVLKALIQAKQNGFKFLSIVGYRVGRSKGLVKNGLRTEFSNHSYGVAIDINSENNGLYDNCTIFGPECRLIRGGHYTPNIQNLFGLVITPQSAIYKSMKAIGWKWGGELFGYQKDFMHFSLTGD